MKSIRIFLKTWHALCILVAHNMNALKPHRPKSFFDLVRFNSKKGLNTALHYARTESQVSFKSKHTIFLLPSILVFLIAGCDTPQTVKNQRLGNRYQQGRYSNGLTGDSAFINNQAQFLMASALTDASSCGPAQNDRNPWEQNGSDRNPWEQGGNTPPAPGIPRSTGGFNRQATGQANVELLAVDVSGGERNFSRALRTNTPLDGVSFTNELYTSSNLAMTPRSIYVSQASGTGIWRIPYSSSTFNLSTTWLSGGQLIYKSGINRPSYLIASNYIKDLGGDVVATSTPDGLDFYVNGLAGPSFDWQPLDGQITALAMWGHYVMVGAAVPNGRGVLAICDLNIILGGQREEPIVSAYRGANRYVRGCAIHNSQQVAGRPTHIDITDEVMVVALDNYGILRIPFPYGFTFSDYQTEDIARNIFGNGGAHISLRGLARGTNVSRLNFSHAAVSGHLDSIFAVEQSTQTIYAYSLDSMFSLGDFKDQFRMGAPISDIAMDPGVLRGDGTSDKAQGRILLVASGRQVETLNVVNGVTYYNSFNSGVQTNCAPMRVAMPARFASQPRQAPPAQPGNNPRPDLLQ